MTTLNSLNEVYVIIEFWQRSTGPEEFIRIVKMFNTFKKAHDFITDNQPAANRIYVIRQGTVE
mgnify:CR=1 FL=1